MEHDNDLPIFAKGIATVLQNLGKGKKKSA